MHPNFTNYYENQSNNPHFQKVQPHIENKPNINVNNYHNLVEHDGGLRFNENF